MYNDLLLNRIVPPIDNSEEEVHDLITEIEELDSLLSPEAQELIEDLRPYIVTDDVYEEIDEQATFGQRVSDRLATFAGSWTFILTFTGLMGVWIVVNAVMGAGAFDPFPFILLNLTLSTLAALQAPVILMAQNRECHRDRLRDDLSMWCCQRSARDCAIARRHSDPPSLLPRHMQGLAYLR